MDNIQTHPRLPLADTFKFGGAPLWHASLPKGADLGI